MKKNGRLMNFKPVFATTGFLEMANLIAESNLQYVKRECLKYFSPMSLPL